MAAVVNVTIDNNGRPVFLTTSMDTQLTQFDIHLNGGPDAWIFNLLESLFNNQLKSMVKKQIDSSGLKAANQAASRVNYFFYFYFYFILFYFFFFYFIFLSFKVSY